MTGIGILTLVCPNLCLATEKSTSISPGILSKCSAIPERMPNSPGLVLQEARP
jgi:hypothetical protein